VYDYTYDLAGNRLQEALSGTGVTARTTDYEYNAANQINRTRVDAGAWTNFNYDSNGNLTSDGVNSYSWDRANRLLEVDNGTSNELTAYAYDGLNNRISQTIGTSSPVVTQYLLDLQPGLVKVIAAATASGTDRYIHAPHGIHAMQSHTGDWTYAVQDALGSVRAEVDSLLAVQGSRQMGPYLTPFDEVGSFVMPFVGTGEMRDLIGLQYHRARYYAPGLGIFPSLDPFEGTAQRPMSLNGYSYVDGNPVNRVDRTGEFPTLIFSALSQVPLLAGVLNSGSCALAQGGVIDVLIETIKEGPANGNR
jgi:RHS repeat-associated protein